MHINKQGNCTDIVRDVQKVPFTQIQKVTHDKSTKFSDRLPSVKTKDFPKTIFPTYANVVNFVTTAIFVTFNILTYFNIKFQIIIINVINPQLNTIVYRPVLYAPTIWLHIFVPTLVWAVPLKLGALQKSGGGHRKKNFRLVPPLSVCFRRLCTEEINKISLSAGDDKRVVIKDGINTMDNRHFSLR